MISKMKNIEMSKFVIFTQTLHVATSDEPKITWGPALTRNAKMHLDCRDGVVRKPAVSNTALAPAVICIGDRSRLYIRLGVVFGHVLGIQPSDFVLRPSDCRFLY